MRYWSKHKRDFYPLICLIISALLFITSSTASAKEAVLPPHKIVAGNFSSSTTDKDTNTLPKQWSPLVFPGISRHTVYTIEGEGKKTYLHAVSRASASGLYRAVDIEAADYPLLSWRWKIKDIIKKGDARRKSGDDYAARIYVTFAFEPSGATMIERVRNALGERLFEITPPGSALNYIWANKAQKDAFILNSYTSKDMMIAVESGAKDADMWIREERNIYEDYIKAFGHKPPPITGIAVMTDSDNTGGSAEAYYDDIEFRKKTSLRD